MLAGLLLFVLFVGEPVLRKASCGAAAAAFRGRLLGIGWASLAVSLASGMLWLVLLAFDLGGHSWRTLISANVLPTLLTETRFGNDWLIRWGFSALLAVCLHRFHRERGWRSRGEGRAGALLGAGLMARDRKSTRLN